MLIKSTLLSIHTYFMSGSSQCYRRTEKISKKLPIGFGKRGKEASLGVVGLGRLTTSMYWGGLGLKTSRLSIRHY